MRARSPEKWALGGGVVIAAAAVVIGLSVGSAVPRGDRADATSAPKYLLAIGDSLAAGYQPTDRATMPPIDAASGFRDQGYPGGYAAGVATAKGLSLVDLACPGETTASMLSTPAQVACRKLYQAEFGVASQTSAAGSFLSRNPGRVALVTIDIGANDLDSCFSTSGTKTSCLQSKDVAAVKNLARLLTGLVASVHRYDPGARIAGMDYYDPFLGLEFSPGGIKGDELALGSLAATNAFNTELNVTFHKYGVTSVDVASAFKMNDATPLVRFDKRSVPQDVASICQLTWMCPSAAGQAADIHPNVTGYRLIAATFEKRLGS